MKLVVLLFDALCKLSDYSRYCIRHAKKAVSFTVVGNNNWVVVGSKSFCRPKRTESKETIKIFFINQLALRTQKNRNLFWWTKVSFILRLMFYYRSKITRCWSRLIKAAFYLLMERLARKDAVEKNCNIKASPQDSLWQFFFWWNARLVAASESCESLLVFRYPVENGRTAFSCNANSIFPKPPVPFVV